MTRILATEWAPLGVDVYGIASGYFPTRMIAPRPGRAGAVAADEKRCGEFEDLNGLMVLFASDACAFITGHPLAVDGGSQ